MNDAARTFVTPSYAVATSVDTPVFSVPARHNPRLQAVAERINADEELRQLWRSANVNAVVRMGWGDCGEVHARIVANAGLKVLRLLREAGQQPAVVTQYRMTSDEAEMVVVLAAAVHELGLAVHSDPQVAARAGLVLAERKIREWLEGVYDIRERAILAAEALHAMAALEVGVDGMTLEAGVLKLADAIDLTKGRARLSLEVSRRLGVANVRPVVEEVTIQRSKLPPVRVLLRLGDTDGLAAVEVLLQSKLGRLRLGALVEFLARVEDQGGSTLWPIRVWQAEAE